jgi:hypothetical protein
MDESYNGDDLDYYSNDAVSGSFEVENGVYEEYTDGSCHDEDDILLSTV